MFFFRVDLCYLLWSVLLHHLICMAPLLELNCTIGLVLRQCFSILFEFQVIRKGYIFSPFLPLVRSCCNSSFILELHHCSNGRSISRVQMENCYYRNGFCLSLWVSCRVGYCHCHLKCVLRSISWVQTENCTIDKQSPYLKLLIIFETGSACHCEWNCRVGYCLEWNCRVGYCHSCCTIGVVLRHCFWILFEFQVIRKGCIFTRPRIANRRRLGTSQPLELYCTIGDTIWVS